jgi:hypothetical protein
MSATGHNETKCIAAEKRLFDHLVGAGEQCVCGTCGRNASQPDELAPPHCWPRSSGDSLSYQLKVALWKGPIAGANNVRVGSIADMTTNLPNVRFARESRSVISRMGLSASPGCDVCARRSPIR